MNKGQLITYKQHFTVQTNPATSEKVMTQTEASEQVGAGTETIGRVQRASQNEFGKGYRMVNEGI